jgi:hypothetical protein
MAFDFGWTWQPTEGSTMKVQDRVGLPTNLSKDSVANPNDPSQLSSWAAGVSRENANRGLYDNLDQIKELLTPLFRQQQQNYTDRFGGALNSQVGQATNQAGAMAAFKGLNPTSYTQSAARGVRQQMVPSYMQGLQELLSNNMSQTLNSTAQANQFKSGNAQSYAQMLMNQSQQAQQNWNQPDLWDYLGAGGLSLLGSALGPLGTAAGSWLGTSIFGSPNSSNNKG